MLKHTKWRNQDPKKVIKKKSFQKWLLEQATKSVLPKNRKGTTLNIFHGSE